MFKSFKLILICCLFVVTSVFAKESENSDDILIAREIVVIKEKMADYSHASLLGAVGDITAVAFLGAVIGALAGLGHFLISRGMLEDLIQGFALPGNNREREIRQFRGVVNAVRIGSHVIQGGVAGFILGLVGQTGFSPQMSKGKLSLILAIQQVIVLLLDCLADYGGIQILEGMAIDFVPAAALVEAVGGRRGLFRAAAIANAQRDNLGDMSLLAMLTTGGVQIVALIATLIPEVLIVRSQRNQDDKKYKALETSLKELQALLQGDTDFDGE